MSEIEYNSFLAESLRSQRLALRRKVLRRQKALEEAEAALSQLEEELVRLGLLKP